MGLGVFPVFGALDNLLIWRDLRQKASAPKRQPKIRNLRELDRRCGWIRADVHCVQLPPPPVNTNCFYSLDTVSTLCCSVGQRKAAMAAMWR
jgi:hypothetical protein